MFVFSAENSRFQASDQSKWPIHALKYNELRFCEKSKEKNLIL